MILPAETLYRGSRRAARGAPRDRTTRGALDALLMPRAIAVIGASRTPDTIGHQVVANLVEHGFTGSVYPVNPKATTIHGLRAYRAVELIPEPVDLAVIALPKELVLRAADDCGRAGVRGLVVLSAGFRETGVVGAAREDALLETARFYRMRVVGPNCLGVLNADPAYRMNATFAPAMPPFGRAALLSQSGAVGVSVLDYAQEYGIGIAQFVSVGNKGDVSGNDLLLQWEHDPAVEVILMYQENFGNPRRFLEIASRITRRKPIIVMKAGRSRVGARAAASHTGALAASDAVVDALLAQAGVLRASSTEELFDMAMAFGAQPLPRSRRAAVLTNSGGPGILAADAMAAAGLELTELEPATTARLEQLLPAEASVGNPVDVIASAQPSTYRAALEALLVDARVDAVLSIFVPPLGVRQEDVAEAIVAAARAYPAKPILAVLMGREGLPQGRAELHAEDIPAYVFPESAARALAALCRHHEWRDRAPDVPEPFPVDAAAAAAIVTRGAQNAHAMLPTADALALVEAYGIPVARARVARDPDAAVAAAAALGYPVALKVLSPDIVHKSDVGGVRTGLADADQLRAAYAAMDDEVRRRAPGAAIDGVLVQRMVPAGREMIAGITRDPLFGPLVMFGLGGVFVEAIGDVVFRLAPIGAHEARAMIDGIRAAPILGAVRGLPPADVDAIATVLRRLSQLAVELPDVAELDINPLIALPGGAIAADARVRIAAA